MVISYWSLFLRRSTSCTDRRILPSSVFGRSHGTIHRYGSVFRERSDSLVVVCLCVFGLWWARSITYVVGFNLVSLFFVCFSKVDENGVITESKFKTFGCGSAIASSSVATEWLKGRSVDESLKIKNTDIAGHLKLPPVKLHCRCVQPLPLL